MKNLKNLVPVLAFLIFISCENKEKNLNQLPEAPVLLSPEIGTVTGTDSVLLTWEKSSDEEGDNILYFVYSGTDSVMFNHVDQVFDEQEVYLTKLEKGKKYFWAIKAENYFNGMVPDMEEGEVWSETRYFYTTPVGVSSLRDTSGHEFVTIYWNDPENTDYVEITFEPKVASIAQPIKVSAGTEKIELTNMENGTIYSFYVTVYNQQGHKSEPETIRSLPLIPIQVHDVDFNIYNAVTIGTQTWLRENLRVTRFQDGSYFVDGYGHIIPPSNFIGSNSDIYGLYYYAEFASGGYNLDKNPCPCGYHVPTDLEWKILESYLGMTDEDVNNQYPLIFRGEKENVGKLLKSVTGWEEYEGESGNGTDFYGLNILAGGYIDNEEIGIGSTCIIWSSSSYDGHNYIIRAFSNSSTGIRRGQSGSSLKASIRCIKN